MPPREQVLKLATPAGELFDAYAVRSESPNDCGLVLLHTMFGINDRFRGFCRDYAALGYTVIAPHLFWRFAESTGMEHDPESYAKGHAYVERLDMLQSGADVAAAVRYLRDRLSVQRVGVIGYCMGGTLAIAAASGSAADMVVAYYPLQIRERMGDYSSLHTPTVIHIGSRDAYAPPAVLDELRAACHGQRAVELHIYPDAEHGFANRRVRSAANESAADLAHARTLAALKRVLGA